MGKTLYRPNIILPLRKHRHHAGRDVRLAPPRGRHRVSIHAPTRGATTRHYERLRERVDVSIHAPTRGATRWPGGALGVQGTVSIHAPTRGATPERGGTERSRLGFNPRAHAGRDAHRGDVARGDVMFQSTRPRGARPVPNVSSRFLTLMFQSTRPRGARLGSGFLGLRDVFMFQSTRPRGARPVVPAHAVHLGRDVSIHAPTRGATRLDGVRLHPQRDVSIHAPTRGATFKLPTIPALASGFNPRAHAGRDERYAIPGAQPGLFQSTRPRGARRASPQGA